jgi:hypothetical protein
MTLAPHHSKCPPQLPVVIAGSILAHMDTAPQTSEAKPARPRRRWLRFSLRTLLVGVTLLCVALGFWVNGAQRQRRAVAAVWAIGSRVEVQYDYQAPGAAVEGELPAPDWLCRLLGVDYFAEMTSVLIPTGSTDATAAHMGGLPALVVLSLDGAAVSDAGLAHLSGLTRLRVLAFEDAQVTDAGLEHLRGLTNLEELYLYGSQVTDEGWVRLQHALPHCKIYR